MIAIALLFVASAAHAQPEVARWRAPDATPSEQAMTESRETFRAGLTAIEDERWSEALASFERAFFLSGQPIALFNGISALRSLGRYREARVLLDQLLERPGDLLPDRIATARQWREEVERRIAVLSIDGAPPGASLFVDGAAWGRPPERPMRAELDPGAHTIRVESETRGAASWSGRLDPGESRAVALQFAPAPVATDEGSIAAEPWFWIAIGGVLAIGAAVAIAIVVATDEGTDRRLAPMSRFVFEL
jgi:tetratricopeptide (TPR) repeat protein